MSDTAASFDDVTLFGGREFSVGDVRRLLGGVLGGAAMGFAAVAAVAASAATVAIAGLWIAGISLSDPPHVQARRPAGPARLALADPAAFPQSSFEARWAAAQAVMTETARVAAGSADSVVAEAGMSVSEPSVASYPQLEVADEVKPAPARVTERPPDAPATPRVAPDEQAPLEQAAAVPLPRSNPLRTTIARGPTELVQPQIAPVATAPAFIKPEAGAQAPALTGPHSRTALYDITGQTVYMPDGERLEAHSGLGHLRDDPRYIKVKNRGPTPPNVYTLKMRERLFHGVRAVRMTPVDESKMFGRDGMLAHSYLLGESGQSNGCISFKDYDRFLQAFLDGKVERIVVVRSLDEAPRQLASLVGAHGEGDNRHAANEITGSIW